MSTEQTFTTRRKVRFEHCDPAGIVFYPRYFEMINAVVEDWFSEALESSFAELISSGRGVPTVSLQTQFHAPSRLGEILTFGLVPQALGRTSLTLEIIATHQDQRRLTAQVTLVLIDLSTGRPLPWPDPVRQLFSPDAT
ncbi:acyl-CoA thioesterase [Billgrantia kenyensis]|uniref:Acyl-CoA thioesterase n=1 Tax=Billgrantia kenyensis TaxID=321266 RepID=A0A7V9W572_9GAMM|nr:thioesterase family protein [Halomonas kenyensis]MBA2781257.1 acyl-CoA thioesterase [Halomonas kenyensis]MCG6662780.1 acyl-CoA thioesterase [Halomonas kenyensis]